MCILNAQPITETYFTSMKELVEPLMRSRSHILYEHNNCSIRFFFTNAGSVYSKNRGKIKISIGVNGDDDTYRTINTVYAKDDFMNLKFTQLIELLDFNTRGVSC